VSAKPLIIGFFAVLAGIAAISVYFSATVDKPDKSVSALLSPDGKYKAVKVTMAGGGTSPYCFDSISVVLAAYPDNFAERDKAYEIYSAPCGGFADHEKSPKIEWVANAGLQITYAINLSALDAKKLSMKNIDVTKTVRVTFVAHESHSAVVPAMAGTQ
jgi:hypothetical protein